jgi:hypothetical protein
MNYEYRINFEGLRKVHRDPTLSVGAKVILIDLILYAGVDGISYPSEETLAKNHKYKSTRQIRNLLKELSQKNLISYKRGKKHITNEYRFHEEIYYRTDKPKKKYISSQSGTTFPSSGGNTLPIKVVNESNQKISSQLRQQFSQLTGKPCTNSEAIRLQELCGKYSEHWVLTAIGEASKKNLPFIKVGIISDILGDFEVDGLPKVKPIFQPCGLNGCENGYKLTSNNTATPCNCRQQYEDKLKELRFN